jgi:hypothetical protein
MLSGGLREGVALEVGFATEAGLVFIINLLFLYFLGEINQYAKLSIMIRHLDQTKSYYDSAIAQCL